MRGTMSGKHKSKLADNINIRITQMWVHYPGALPATEEIIEKLKLAFGQVFGDDTEADIRQLELTEFPEDEDQ